MTSAEGAASETAAGPVVTAVTPPDEKSGAQASWPPTYPPNRMGREGRLYLSLRRGHDSDTKTRLTGCRSEPPLSVQRALYCEPGLPDMAYVYVASTSGGILQGDRHAISIGLGADAMAHVTTQGATRIYGTNRGAGGAAGLEAVAAARQALRISMGERSYLEYIPDQTIPYAGSVFWQDVELSIHDTATLAYAEILSPGRAGMGESFAYRLYGTRIRAVDQDGGFRFADAARITPLDSRVDAFGVMGGYDTVASVYVITEQRYVESLQKGIDEMILQNHDGSDVTGGAAVMSGGAGVLVRLLGTGTEHVRSAVDGAAGLVRRTVLDAPFTRVRKS